MQAHCDKCASGGEMLFDLGDGRYCLRCWWRLGGWRQVVVVVSGLLLVVGYMLLSRLR